MIHLFLILMLSLSLIPSFTQAQSAFNAGLETNPEPHPNYGGTTWNVNSAATLSAANAGAEPGDVIIVADGTYSSFSFNITANGNASSYIIIKPATPNGVTFTGTSSMWLYGDYLWIEEFNFISTSSHALVVLDGANHNRVTRNVFQNCGSDNQSAVRVLPTALFLEFDNNDLSVAKGAQVIVAFSPTTNIPGNFITQGHHFHHNYFHNLSGGWELLTTIGGSGDIEENFQNRFEYNFISDYSGDPELLSIKGGGWIIKYNWIQNTTSDITLRYSSNSVIHGNILLNNLQIRVAGTNHTITNNYISGAGPSIWFHQGFISNLGVTEYIAASNNLIAHNTFRTTSERVIGTIAQGTNFVARPTGNTFVNNILWKTQIGTWISGPNPNEFLSENTWRYDFFWNDQESYAGEIPSGTGVVNDDPELTLINGIYQPIDDTPPIVDAGESGHATTDVLNLPRDASPDIGAVEFQQNVPGPDITTGLLAHYTLNESSGTSAADSATGDGTQNATITGGVTLGISGHLNGAFQFNGSTGYLSASSSPINLDEGAISLWINPDFSTYPSTPNFFFDTDSARHAFYIGGSPGAFKTNTGTKLTAYQIGFTQGWHHIVFIWDKDGAEPHQFYYDGVKQTQTSTSGTWGTQTSGSNLYIGTRFNQVEFFDGGIDQIRIYNRALESQDVSALFNEMEEGDTTPPHNVAVTSPSDESIINGVVGIMATAEDNVQVSHVEFLHGTTIICTDNTPFLWNCDWDTLLVADGAYSLTVKAYDTASPIANMTESSAVDVTIDNTPTSAPTDLILTAFYTQNGYGMGLDWADVTGAVSYEIDRCTGTSCSDFSLLDTSLVSLYSDDLLSANTEYCYRIRTLDTVGNPSAYSSTVCESTLSTILLSEPLSLTTTHSSTVTSLGEPLSLTTTHSGTVSTLGSPSMLSTTNSANPIFLSPPSGLDTP